MSILSKLEEATWKTLGLGVCVGFITYSTIAAWEEGKDEGIIHVISVLGSRLFLRPILNVVEALSWAVGLEKRKRSLKSHRQVQDELEAQFRVGKDKLISVLKGVQLEMVRGLSTTQAAAGENSVGALPMIPSHVTRMPTGEEKGTFLAVDLGGTNFRVCEVSLQGSGHFKVRQKKFTISDAVKSGPGSNLFDFVADCIETFCTEVGMSDLIRATGGAGVSLGFTFSFGVNQTSINHGTLNEWTKGFSCSGVVGKDVVELFQDSLKRKSLNIRVDALVNDTVGTLVAHAYTEPTDTFVGVILGTGSNAAYVEKTKNITKIPALVKGATEDSIMLINIEWGAFDHDRLILPFTKYDSELDRDSLFPGRQLFEKMVSGMYLGEIVRLILVDLMECGKIFANCPANSINELKKKDSFHTAFMSRIERDKTSDLIDVKNLLTESFFLDKNQVEDRYLLRSICELVSTRAARLSATAIGAILQKIGRVDGGSTVAIDGSLFEHYPSFASRMMDALRELFGLCAENINLAHATDGSGVGAAIIAMLASKE